MSGIQLRGVRVHNLKSVDLDLSYEKLIAFCGVSGSGKSSLAIDTLYAEGQRRYIESFSAYTRQFLEKLEKPDAEEIEGILPAAAITAKSHNPVTRATIGTSTETLDYLRLLFSKIGKLYCRKCNREVRHENPESILGFLTEKWGTTVETSKKLMIAFAPSREQLYQNCRDFEAEFRETGLLRGVISGQSFRLDEKGIPETLYDSLRSSLGILDDFQPGSDCSENGIKESCADLFAEEAFFDVDAEEESGVDELGNRDIRISEETDSDTEEDSGENSEVDESKVSAFFISSNGLANSEVIIPVAESLDEPVARGLPQLYLIVDRLVWGKTEESRIRDSLETALELGNERCYVLLEKDSAGPKFSETAIDGETWNMLGFSRLLSCEDCGIDYPRMEPKLFSFNSPLGACPVCEGFGNLVAFDLDLIIPNPNRTLREGAIAPWNTPSYKSKLKELIDRSEELGVAVDVPFEELSLEQQQIVLYGSEKDKYEGLRQFFDKLQKQKYKMHIRVFLSRWRSYRTCLACSGTRLRAESLAVKIAGYNIAQFCEMPIAVLYDFLQQHVFTDWERAIGQTTIQQVLNRLRYLNAVGLGYLRLDRMMRTLSGGEQRRIGLTSALGSSLVNMLYVLDEPSIGLHPEDIDRLLKSILELRDRGNTVVVVEHEELLLKAADQIVEVGPEAGAGGGQIVFQGTPQEMMDSAHSLTGSYLSGKRTGGVHFKRRQPEHGLLELFGASGRNLKGIDVKFPMGLLCLITGVSGTGKSTLIQETLYPALSRRLGKENAPLPLPYTQILGTGQIDDVVMVDQGSIGRSPRSNPVTYLKIFDEIRAVFAETLDAKTRNFGAGHFSFNVDGGRCNTCKGEGYIGIDMQFLADMYVKCPQCQGRRYQREVLDILYRGKNIADVLDMTAREAFGFFRGQPKVQKKLKRLMDVGLDYIRLGQPANTLSGGESQRLKLAAYLSNVKKGRCLFLLDEPTTGLHFADIVQLLDCFDALIETGHSLIVVEHNLQMMRAADYIIDLGPGPAELGGRIVAQGSPEEIANSSESLTGRFLRSSFQAVSQVPCC
ncbi:MAG: excinuclease ABC subunit UvrA [Thermoguttaceae bacterium]